MNDTLYIGCNGNVAAIRPEDGQRLWLTELGGVFSRTAAEDVCVLEHEGRVFAGCNGHLFCLDGATGEIVWHNELPGLGHNDVTLTIAGKAIQVVATHTHSHTRTP
ncbi:MAG TPA: PQQ-binding-like beta-propeller repeat protein [Thermoanaerobaculia bacterium]|nr:PQQ-binding-like beta-propeller repeat protein [Thermoanaerobaculia bacterium]